MLLSLWTTHRLDHIKLIDNCLSLWTLPYWICLELIKVMDLLIDIINWL